jgi:hypothetical protein
MKITLFVIFFKVFAGLTQPVLRPTVYSVCYCFLMPMSTTGCRMSGRWVGKPMRKETRSETVREIIRERSLKEAGFIFGDSQ